MQIKFVVVGGMKYAMPERKMETVLVKHLFFILKKPKMSRLDMSHYVQ